MRQIIKENNSLYFYAGDGAYVLCVEDTTPLNIEIVGEVFSVDIDRCKFDGTIIIGRIDGTAELIRVEGGTVEFEDNKQVRITNATVFSLVGNVTLPLFRGNFTIPFSSARSSLFTESGSAANEFKLGGLDFDFKSIFIDKNDIKLGTEFSLPEEITGSAIKITLFPDLNPNPNVLVISNSGVLVGLSGEAKFPVNGSFKLFKLLKVEASDLSISYSAPDDILKIQGKLNLSKFTKSLSSTAIEADLTGANFIQIKDGKPDFVGSISVKNLELPRGWNLGELKLFLDTANNRIEGDALVSFPFGKQPVLFRKSTAEAGVGVVFVDGELDSIKGSITLPAPGIPVGTTGFFLSSAAGSINHLASNNSEPIEFVGDAKFVSRITGGLASIDVTGKINSEEASGNGTFEFINSNILSASVGAKLNWNKNLLEVGGNFSFLKGIINANTRLKANSKLNFTISGKAGVTIPKQAGEFKIPLIGGKEITSGNFLADYSNDGTLSNDFAAGWGTFEVTIPLLGKIKVTLGVKGFFDGRFESFGSRNIPETNSFDVLPGTQWIILSADWENANPNTKVRIKTPSGTFIDEVDFASNNFAIVDEFTDSDTRAVAIPNPVPGIWDILVVDPTGLGTIDYNAIRDSIVPTIQITSPALDVTTKGTVNIGFNALDSDSTAIIKLFYDDDNTGLDGILIADNLVENDGAGSFTWNTEGVPIGDYFIYAMIMDDENVPVFSNYSTGKVKIREFANLATPTLTKISDDIFTISGGADKPKLQVTLTEGNSNLVNELGVFTVDDAQGKINGIAPGEAGYLQAALNKAKVVFSTIANRPNGFNINNLTSLLEFNSGDNLRFFLIKNGTIDSARNGITPITDILFSDLSRQKITDLGTDGFSLAWKDGSNNNTDFKDLVVKIKSTNDPLPLGTNLQGTQQGEVIDLRDINQDVKVNFVVNREAAFNNFVGFYKVADENGGIDIDGNGTADFRPGDSGYAQAAVKNRVAGIDLRVENQGTATFTDKLLTGGSIFAPFILTNGRTVDQVMNGQVDQAYFAYLGANSDKVDHIRLLGNNIFGFEDLSGGGDNDFNDVIVRAELTL